MSKVHKSNIYQVNHNFVHDILRRRLLAQAGVLLEEHVQEQGILTLEQILQFKWSDKFIQLMKNRLLVGGYRHGLNPSLDYFTYIKDIKNRAEKYIETGNDELLVDIANLCMLLYKLGNHPNKHLKTYKALRFEDIGEDEE